MKSIILTTIKKLRITILFMEDAFVYDSSRNKKYIKALVKISGKPFDTIVSGNLIEKTIEIGTQKDTPYTAKETYTFIVNNFGQAVANEVKDLYLEGIEEDITQ